MKSKILLSHGSGGKLMHSLIEDVFRKKFHNEILDELGDSAVLGAVPEGKEVCFTTDSYVVNPLFFPGGDIGRLAMCGTINDLASVGAKPLYISCGFIIEEGLQIHTLEKIVESMSRVCVEEGVRIVTGDVKVVERNSADKVFINTSGIGIKENTVELNRSSIKPTDRIIVSGTIGEHGLAILSARESLQFEAEILSDCTPLSRMVSEILEASSMVKFMRDPTRGGVAVTLNEMVEGMDFGILIQQRKIPVRDEVKSLCEILGFDPLYIANEGKIVLVVSKEDAENVLKIMRRNPVGRKSEIIGEITEEPEGRVIMETEIGGHRVIDMPVGEQLPRIC